MEILSENIGRKERIRVHGLMDMKVRGCCGVWGGCGCLYKQGLGERRETQKAE